jgi:hypothetical protein
VVSCEEEGKVIHVVAASVGRTTLTACPHAAMHRTDCDQDVTPQVRRLCSGLPAPGAAGEAAGVSRCEVCEGKDGVGGDPHFCENTYKYVNVTYACVRPAERRRLERVTVPVVVEQQRLHTFEFSFHLHNARTSAVAVESHRFVFEPLPDDAKGAADLSADDKAPLNSAAVVVAGPGAGGSSHVVGGRLVGVDGDEEVQLGASDAGLRVTGSVQLAAKRSSFSGHFVVRAPHPLLALVDHFLPAERPEQQAEPEAANEAADVTGDRGRVPAGDGQEHSGGHSTAKVGGYSVLQGERIVVPFGPFTITAK